MAVFERNVLFLVIAFATTKHVFFSIYKPQNVLSTSSKSLNTK